MNAGAERMKAFLSSSRGPPSDAGVCASCFAQDGATETSSQHEHGEEEHVLVRKRVWVSDGEDADSSSEEEGEPRRHPSKKTKHVSSEVQAGSGNAEQPMEGEQGEDHADHMGGVCQDYIPHVDPLHLLIDAEIVQVVDDLTAMW